MKSEAFSFLLVAGERATFTFYRIQLQWLESVGHFTPSDEAKSASLSEAPMSKDSERATFAFYGIQLQWLECSAASLLPERQKAPQGQKLHPTHILNEPLSLFINICYNSKNRGGTLYAKRFR